MFFLANTCNDCACVEWTAAFQVILRQNFELLYKTEEGNDIKYFPEETDSEYIKNPLHLSRGFHIKMIKASVSKLMKLSCLH